MSVGVVTPERVARLLLMACLASFALPLRAAADTPLICATTVPQHAVAPKLPAILHNEFEGSYDVRFVVGVDGRTRDIHVHANNLRPIGRSHGQPVGYDEAVLAAVRQWQYAKQPRPCHVSTSVQINYQDASGEMSN
jgi:hypothetical protein